MSSMMVFPIGTPSTSKYSGNNFLFCSRSLCRSMYVHIVFMKFLYGQQRFVPFICLKPDTKRYNSVVNRMAHRIINLTSRRPGVLHVILIALFLRDPYEVLTKSVRDLDFARQGSRNLFYSSLLCPRPL